jgi:hypothetical protein
MPRWNHRTVTAVLDFLMDIFSESHGKEIDYFFGYSVIPGSYPTPPLIGVDASHDSCIPVSSDDAAKRADSWPPPDDNRYEWNPLIRTKDLPNVSHIPLDLIDRLTQFLLGRVGLEVGVTCREFCLRDDHTVGADCDMIHISTPWSRLITPKRYSMFDAPPGTKEP